MNIPAQRTWAEINLDALAENIRVIKKMSSPAKLMAVVKADAYGHGVTHVVSEMLENGADYLAVACINEAMQLRSMGIDAPILILGYILPADMPTAVENNILLTIYDYNDAVSLSKAAALCNKPAKIHIKLDTGMHRIGFMADDDETIEKIKAVHALDGIEIEGIFTHFAKADEEDPSYTLMQYELFDKCCQRLEAENIKIPYKHTCNSAGIIKFKDMHLNMVRSGIINYGLTPFAGVPVQNLNLQPVMSVKTTVTRIQYIKKGQKISYGGTFTAPCDMKVATLSIGYADGYPRHLSGKGKVIVNGVPVNIVGRICMDQCMINVTCVNNIDIGDVAVIIGKDAETEVSCEFLADLAGTINYELVCMVSRRVPRIYVKDGKIVDVVNYLV